MRAALAGLLVAGAWWSAYPRASMPPVSPLGDQLVYAPTDPAALVLLEPVLHAPWLGEPQGWGRLIAVLVAAIGATGVAIFAGASLLATVIVVGALMADASFGAALSHAAPLAVAVGLVWLAAGAAFDEHQRVSPARPWFNPLAAILLWAGAAWFHWIAVVAWPIVFAALRRTPQRPARGAWTAASLAVGVLAFVGHFHGMARIAGAHAFAPDALLTARDAMAVAFDSRPWMPSGSYAAADLTTGVSLLAVGLSAAALAFGGLERWWRRAVILSVLLAAAVLAGWPEWQSDVLRFGAWALTPLAAVGLTWAARQVRHEHLSPVATIAIGAVLVTETVVAGWRPLVGQDARGFRDALERALREEVSGRIVMVAEDTRLDSALVAWGLRRADTARAAQEGPAVAAAIAEGRTVLAGPVGRRHLELAGVTFRRLFTITDPAPFVMSSATSALRCVAVLGDRWSQLPGVEYTGRLGIEVPAAVGGELQLIVGDTLPLQISVESADGRASAVTIEPLLSGPGVAAPPPDYWFDGGLPEDGPHVIERVRLPAQAARASLLSVQLGRRAPRVIARLAGMDETARGRICAAPVGREALLGGGTVIEPISLDDATVFGTGWYGLQREGTLMYRWADTDAVVLVPSMGGMGVEIALHAEGVDADGAGAADGADGADGTHGAGAADGADGAGAADAADSADDTDERGGGKRGRAQEGEAVTVTLRVNGIDVGTRAMEGGVRRYMWTVPAAVWLEGTNELWWHTSRAVRPSDTGGTDTRRLALKVTGLEVSR